MAPQVGLVSGRLEEKEYGFKPGSRVYAGPDWGWQTQESYQKTIKMRRGGAFFDWVATTVGDPIKAAISPVVQAVAPVVQPVAEAVSGIIQSTPVVGPLSQAVSTTTETLRQEAAQRGIDPRVADVAMMAGEELVGGVVGKTLGMASKVINNLPGPPTPGLAMAGAAPMPAPMQLKPTIEKGGMVLKATTSPEWTGPGMGQDVAKTPKYRQTVESYMESVPTFSDAAAEIERRFATGEITESRRKNALSKLKKKADAELSTFAYDPENPPVYAESRRTKATKEAQIPDPIAELITEKPAKAHQHHYLAKAQTRPFVNKMLELVKSNIADLDDLVNFFTWPEQYKLYPGNVRSNMADLSPRAHVPSEAVTDFDRKFNVHRMLQDIGLEVKSGTKGGATEFITKNYGLKNVKTADDLMRAWDQFLQEIGIPGKEAAKTIQEFFLTEYRKQLSGDKLKQFNEMAAKLYK
jgi:hypothetical protein